MSGQRIGALVLALVFVIALIALVRYTFTADFGSSSRQPRPPVAGNSRPPSPRSAPSARKTAPARETLMIQATGDVSLDPDYISNFNTYGYDYAWSGMKGLFQRDDLTIVNLECPVSLGGVKFSKQFTFRGDPAALPAMKEAGVEVANIGNNHSYDYGMMAFLDTLRYLDHSGITAVGGGKDDEDATKPRVFNLKGWKVAVVGIAGVVEPAPEAVAAPGHPGVACHHDVDCMVGAIRRADKVADLVVVVIHWGVELHPEPNSTQIDWAHQFIDAGADAIFGHHSHRLGSVETYKGRPIFWSLGNFVWPAFSGAGATTGVARVVVTPDAEITYRLLPAYIESSGHPVLRGT
ncbi:MAG TPA: CapA family protein [Actinomycetota bacterium]